jgi:uncharacterized membrane protein
MSTLTVWKFDSSEGAESAALTLRNPPSNERESVHDAARVSWALGASKPMTRPMDELASDEALGEHLFGLLFALIFYSPLLGAAVGSARGPCLGSLADVGIDDTFVNRVRDTVTSGTSAIFVLGSDAAVDQVREALRVDPPVHVLVTRLSRRQAGALHQVLSDESSDTGSA